MPSDATKKSRGPRGMGSVFYDARRKLHIARLPLGNGKYKVFQAPTEKEALAKRNDYCTDVARGLKDPRIKPSDMTLAYLCNQWLESHTLREGLGPITVDSYQRKLLSITRAPIGLIKVSDLTDNDIINWQTTMLKREIRATTRKALMLLKATLKWAVKRKLIVYSPAQDLELPRVIRHKVAPPESATLLAFLQHLRGTELGVIVAIALVYGLRRQEVLGLRWNDIDFDGRKMPIRWRVGYINRRGPVVQPGVKMDAGNTVEWLRLTPQVIVLLEEQRDRLQQVHRDAGPAWKGPAIHPTKGLSYVFPCTRIQRAGRRSMQQIGGPKAPHRLLYEYQQACAEVPSLGHRTFHRLRHDFAGLLREQGTPMDAVQRIMRHSDISVTNNLYAHLRTEMFDGDIERLHDRMLGLVQKDQVERDG